MVLRHCAVPAPARLRGSTYHATQPESGGSNALTEYKGYAGNIEFDDEAGIFHREVINTRDAITFQGVSVTELKKTFRESVEDYLGLCHERGEETDKPFSGQFVIHVSPDLHRRFNVAATLSGMSLNACATEQQESRVRQVGAHRVADRRPLPLEVE
jgi:predicted HicB family RNase H-like nuclease